MVILRGLWRLVLMSLRWLIWHINSYKLNLIIYNYYIHSKYNGLPQLMFFIKYYEDKLFYAWILIKSNLAPRGAKKWLCIITTSTHLTKPISEIHYFQNRLTYQQWYPHRYVPPSFTSRNSLLLFLPSKKLVYIYQRCLN